MLLVLVPLFSSFSMRQVQESSIALALSAVSLVMLVLTAHLGASLIFRDIDRRYLNIALAAPISRSHYLLGRFVGLAIFLCVSMIILALCSSVVIALAASTYQSQLPIAWGTIALAFTGICIKYLLLSSVAVFFSCLSTSFSLPFFSTIAIYLAGTASQEVYEYLNGSLGEKLPEVLKVISKIVYFACPNFSSFDLNIYAVYALPVNHGQFLLSIFYGIVFTSFVLWLSVIVFNRREL
jgi:Cu-processing system permease protein